MMVGKMGIYNTVSSILILYILSSLTVCCKCHLSEVPSGSCEKETGACSQSVTSFQDRMILAQQALARDGVTVVPGVLTTEECHNFILQLHEWLDKFGPDSFPETKSSIIHSYNIGYHPVAWMTKLKSAPVFESLWGTEKLTSSIDGMAIGPPPEIKILDATDGGRHVRLHLDQGEKKQGLHAYQAAVYLEDADEDDWCFVVINGSQKYHKEFFEMRNKPKQTREQVVLTEDEISWYEQNGCQIRKVAVPKGGMVIWDSRTVHAGSKPLENRKNPHRWRYVVLVCMVPAIWVNADEMAQKKEAYKELLHTRHWPAQGFQTFYRRPVPVELNAANELPEMAKTEKARLLAGDLEYDFNDGKPNGGKRPKYIADPLTPKYI